MNVLNKVTNFHVFEFFVDLFHERKLLAMYALIKFKMILQVLAHERHIQNHHSQIAQFEFYDLTLIHGTFLFFNIKQIFVTKYQFITL